MTNAELIDATKPTFDRSIPSVMLDSMGILAGKFGRAPSFNGGNGYVLTVPIEDIVDELTKV